MSIEIKENKSYVLKTAEKYCKCDIVVEPVVESADELGAIVPTTDDQNIFPDEGYVGIGSALIKGVTSDIDENIKPENIKDGVEILGVEGTYYIPEEPNLTPENIKSGVTIYDIEGTYVKPDEPNLTPENIKSGVTIYDIEGTYYIPEEPNLLPENIVYGADIFGVTGGLTAGSSYLSYYGTTKRTTSYGIKVYDMYCKGFSNIISEDYQDSHVVIGTCCPTGTNSAGEYYPGIVTSVGSYAFQNKTKIKSVIFPEGITIVNDYAFSGCTGLNKVVFPNTFWLAGRNSFSGCTSLTSIKLPNKIVSLGYRAFSGCTNLKEVDISSFRSPTNQGEGYPYPSISTGVFDYTSDDLEILIPDDLYEEWTQYSNWNDYVKYIYVVDKEGNKFTPGLEYNDTNEIIGPGTVSTFKLYIPKTASNIAANAFLDNDFIKEVYIPSSITTINAYAFNKCMALEKVTLSEGVTKIGSGAFSGISNLKEVRFLGFANGMLPIIASYAFNSPTGERKAVLPSKYIDAFKEQYDSYGWFTSYEAL